MTASITDFNQFTDLRRMAGQGDSAALREVAGQFEALFIQNLLKNMREASLGEGLFGDSEQHKLYQGMLDKQLSLEMASGDGIGIAEMLVRQLGSDNQPPPRDVVGPGEVVGTTYPGPSRPVPAPDVTERGAFDSPESFVRELWPHIKEIAGKLGVEARSIMAQAALETGWGQHVPESADGVSSFNVFGIKADKHWNGDAVAKQTLEFRGGVAERESARFRAYESIAESVSDYFEFLTGSVRYDAVGKEGGDPEAFGRSLAQAGYATDPEYASKISRVASSDRMNELIGELEGAEPLLGAAGAAASP